LILRGIAQGVPTAKLAREVGVSRQHPLRPRHAIQARALAAADCSPLPDDQAEADEMYQNAGGKRGAAHRSTRPAAAAGEPGQGPRHLGHRPASSTGGGRPHQWPAVGPRRAAEPGRGVGARKRIIVTLRPSSSRYQAVRSSHLQRLIFYGPLVDATVLPATKPGAMVYTDE
jgi:hypothetical protein